MKVALIVQKFGGTSVADASKVKAAAKRAVAAKQAGHQVVMVVSARGKKTDELLTLAAEITDKPAPREIDMLLSTGEQESSALMAMAIHELGEDAISLTGAQIGVVTDSSHTKARILDISTERMKKALNEGKIVIAAGFQGVDEDFNITTLGRGGSDTTATALAAVLQADECEIYTDVEGVFTTDPRLVEDARKINQVEYDEMLEMASLGAGVMHSRSIEFAKKYQVPIRVRPSYADGEGTLITETATGIGTVVTGVALMKNVSRVTLSKIPDRPGIMNRIFTKMAGRKIPIDMIVQDVSSGGLAEVSFTVPEDELADALTAAEEAIQTIGEGEVLHGTNLSKVSAVGHGMKTHSGVASLMFQSLADANINIGMVTTSDIKVSVLVSREECEQAVKAIHEGFELEKEKPVVLSVGEKHTPESTQSEADLVRDIVKRLGSMEDIVVSEVQLDESEARITIRNLPDKPGIAARVFSAVAEGGIMVDMIVQNVSRDNKSSISFTIPSGDVKSCVAICEKLFESDEGAEILSDEKVAKLSVVGIGLRSHTGVGEKMFSALSEAGINVQLINTSEIRVSAVVDSDSGELALQKLHDAFDL